MAYRFLLILPLVVDSADCRRRPRATTQFQGCIRSTWTLDTAPKLREHPGNGIDGNRGMIGGIVGGNSPNKQGKAIKLPSTAPIRLPARPAHIVLRPPTRHRPPRPLIYADLHGYPPFFSPQGRYPTLPPPLHPDRHRIDIHLPLSIQTFVSDAVGTTTVSPSSGTV
jgi:hypothetical protein